MDFIERLFRLSPDGGSGATETLWIGLAFLALANILFRKRILSVASRLLTGRS
jgi:hypothetical protein